MKCARALSARPLTGVRLLAAAITVHACVLVYHAQVDPSASGAATLGACGAFRGRGPCCVFVGHLFPLSTLALGRPGIEVPSPLLRAPTAFFRCTSTVVSFVRRSLWVTPRVGACAPCGVGGGVWHWHVLVSLVQHGATPGAPVGACDHGVVHVLLRSLHSSSCHDSFCTWLGTMASFAPTAIRRRRLCESEPFSRACPCTLVPGRTYGGP